MISMLSSVFLQEGVRHEKAEPLGSEFVMHHITDHVVVPIHLWGVDLSITKHVFFMWIVAAISILLFSAAFRKPKLVPSGLANFFEFIIEILNEEVMQPYLGKQSGIYAPYLLTAFFFVLFCNLFGLVPGGGAATGDISVTATLAILTFLMVQIAGVRNHGLIGYCKGLIPPNLPLFVLIIMIPVEIVGLMTKHVALAIRLFANMVAGHVVIFALLMIIFMFKNFAIAGITMGGLLFVSLLEVLIALIQAYIFTILSSVFIGMAVYQDH